jgi:hypothetical protein
MAGTVGDAAAAAAAAPRHAPIVRSYSALFFAARKVLALAAAYSAEAAGVRREVSAEQRRDDGCRADQPNEDTTEAVDFEFFDEGTYGTMSEG